MKKNVNACYSANYTTDNSIKNPEAWISVNKNRQKVYGNSIYLQDETHFEIEFFNPTSNNILAKIEFNGKNISGDGIVIKPGQREWLERYIDDNKKFLFTTYFIEDSKEAKKAIENNGNIVIKFYNEEHIYNYSSGTIYINNPYNNNPYYDYTIYGYSKPINKNFYHSAGTNAVQCSCNSNNINNHSNMIETGRVEKGDVSNQEFSTCNINFNYYTCNEITYKLLPISHQPKVLGEIKKYCTRCGKQIKKSSWKFCPSCGEEI